MTEVCRDDHRHICAHCNPSRRTGRKGLCSRNRARFDGSRDPVASRRFDDLIQEAQIIIEPVTEVQARIAREAYRDFGKGSGHPAKLNFGDCFAYALARATGQPLLFRGDDFIHTDVVPALG